MTTTTDPKTAADGIAHAYNNAMHALTAVTMQIGVFAEDDDQRGVAIAYEMRDLDWGRYLNSPLEAADLVVLAADVYSALDRLKMLAYMADRERQLLLDLGVGEFEHPQSG